MREKENTQEKNPQVINGMLIWIEARSTCTNKIQGIIRGALQFWG